MLKELINEVEKHTGEKFDLSNRRHFFQLDEKIKRLNSEDLRILALIKMAVNSTSNENNLYNDKAQYLRNR